MSDSPSSTKRSRLEIAVENAAKSKKRLREIKAQTKRKERKIEYAAKRRERKADDNRKFTLAGMVLAHARRSPAAAGWISDMIQREKMDDRVRAVMTPVIEEMERLRAAPVQRASAPPSPKDPERGS